MTVANGHDEPSAADVSAKINLAQSSRLAKVGSHDVTGGIELGANAIDDSRWRADAAVTESSRFLRRPPKFTHFLEPLWRRREQDSRGTAPGASTGVATGVRERSRRLPYGGGGSPPRREPAPRFCRPAKAPEFAGVGKGFPIPDCVRHSVYTKSRSTVRTCTTRRTKCDSCGSAGPQMGAS